MTDVLIRGMEMPDGCHNCGFSYFDKGETNGGELCIVLMCSIINQGTKGADYNGYRPSWCPLVPLPAGHGRLIDADALRKEIDANRPGRIYEDGWALTVMDYAPTIVPAEGGGEDG